MNLWGFVFGCIPLRFEVDGNVAVMTGDLTRSAPRKVGRLIESNPQLEWIELLDCPGSLDDEAALEAARMVRSAGLNTRVGSEGEIASGAVDFFIAGVERNVEVGARIGVHSWSDGSKEGVEYSKDHREHRLYLNYYREMGIDASFYWFTLNSAGSDDIHWMTIDELGRYGLTTE